MKEQQEQNINTQEKEDLDLGSDLNSSNYKKLRQNKIIIAIVVLLLCLILIFVLISSPNRKKEEVKIKKLVENEDLEEKDDDSLDLGLIDNLGIEEKNKDSQYDSEEDLSLKIPPLPELDIKSIEIEEAKKMKEKIETQISENDYMYDEIIVNDGKEINEEKTKKLPEKDPGEDNIAMAIDPRKTPIVIMGDSSGASHPDSSMMHENNIEIIGEDYVSKFEESKTSITTKIIKNRDNIIGQGKKISGTLETAINTEVPGFVRAIISRDVYPEQGDKPLIPRGSRVYGSYSKDILRGQERVNISWTRLLRPDGVEVVINFMASDEFGRAGIKGDVDNRYGNIIKNSVLSTVLAIGTGAIADLISDGGTTISTEAGASSVTSSAVSTITTDIAGYLVEIIKAKIDSFDDSPVIRIPQGTKITIIVQSDMEMPHMQNY